MIILLVFAFISGILTIAAPCIWPLLPIVLSGTASGGKRKPLGIALGIIISFGLITLTIAYLVKIIPFDQNILRYLAVLVISLLGLMLIIPKLSQLLESGLSKLSSKFNFKTNKNNNSFWSGLLLGLSLGIVWSPCAGPILATIATLSATRSINLEIILVTAIYLIGAGIPLFLFATLGNYLFIRSRILSSYTGRIQQIFGLVMILTALLILTNYDKILQAKLLNLIPSYSNFLNQLEGNKNVQEELNRLKKSKNNQFTGAASLGIIYSSLPVYGKAPEFTGINNWLNANHPLTQRELRGKVVLIDFWTYTCINCIRTLPFVTGWYEKYKDKGFAVVGVHTPEFEFEKDTKNVQNAILQYKIHYPVAQDNDYQTWNAYQNQYWPAEYLIDSQGNIRKFHFGEGEYDQMETAIQKLLTEAGSKTNHDLENLPDQTPKTTLSPETYLGSARRERFTDNSIGLPLNYFTLIGPWDTQPEFISSKKDSTLVFHFKTSKVFLVIHPSGTNDSIKVSLDDMITNETNAGKDVQNGILKIDQPRLYELIDLKGKYGEHILKLEMQNAGIKLFAFTFG